MAKKPTVKKESLIECEVLRKLCLDDGLKEVGTIINVSRELAKKFQDANAVKIIL